MSDLRKILTIQEEAEIEDVYYKIYAWYAEQLQKHKTELPVEEFRIAKASLSVFLREASRLRNAKDLVGIKAQFKQTIWFILPWPVTLWYSFMKKDKKGEKDTCSKNQRLLLKKSK